MSLTRTIFEEHHTHNGNVDSDQVNIIFNPSKRLLVEAPAGYGKTKTMVSKLAYIITSDQLPNSKKILALTFSVNASLNIRAEVLKHVNLLFEDKIALRLINQRVQTSNYHGLSRNLLNLYGYLIHPKLLRLNMFNITDEELISNLDILDLTRSEKDFLKSYDQDLKSIGKPGIDMDIITNKLKDNQGNYINILLEKLIPNEYLTYNGILLLTIFLFGEFKQVSSFYRKYFPIIFVDEFQDTNWLQWKLLQGLTGGHEIVSSSRQLHLFGDRVQRIYGFIGAIPNIFELAQKEYEMEIKKLKTNHRFNTNSNLGKIDRVLRANAENIRNPDIHFSVELPVIKANTQADVAYVVRDQVQQELSSHRGKKIAILVRTGLNSATTIEIINTLKTSNIQFFFALYSEIDKDYIDFHTKCFDICKKALGDNDFQSIKSFISKINQEVSNLPKNEVNTSLASLLNLFMRKVQKEYSFLSINEKIQIILDTLANRGLKQQLNLVIDEQVILATIHGAKGLEWDSVILPDIQRYSFPVYYICKQCNFCSLDWSRLGSQFENSFLDELSVFYVAVTRAKIDLTLMYSEKVKFKNGNVTNSHLSCLARLPGFENVIKSKGNSS